MESRFPAWISQFLLRGGGARNGLLQQEDMQVQLRELEGRILAHVAEMRGESAREAAASLGLTLQREGVIGVTEEQVVWALSQIQASYDSGLLLEPLSEFSVFFFFFQLGCQACRM